MIPIHSESTPIYTVNMMESGRDAEALAHMLMADYAGLAYETVNRMRAIALDNLDTASFGFWGQVLAVLVANNFQMDTATWWRERMDQ